jgi:hypothetical protein
MVDRTTEGILRAYGAKANFTGCLSGDRTSEHAYMQSGPEKGTRGHRLDKL